MKRADMASKLFLEGYNCSQSVFAAFSDLYGIDHEMALKLSASFGGGLGRMREVCGAVSGMGMVAGLETGSTKKMDDEGKKYNYQIVQNLAKEFIDQNGSIICRELLGLDKDGNKEATPQKRDDAYYNSRPCEQLVRDAAEILERVLYAVTLVAVTEEEQILMITKLAERIWQEHYELIIGKAQVDYMLERYQSVAAIHEQIEKDGYEYFLITCPGGTAGYLSIHREEDALFLSKFYLSKEFRHRGFARKAMEFLEQCCRDKKLKYIWLTVNKNNGSSIAAYEGLGFLKTITQTVDIGSGFVMDDFIMEKKIDL